MMHLIPNPTGDFAFVGKVPAPLAFLCSSDKYLEIAAHCGPGLAIKAAKREGGVFKTRSYPTREAALDAALEWAGSSDELAKHYSGAA